MKEKITKNNPVFKGKKQMISSVSLRLFFVVLFFPALVFGQGVYIQEYSVSSVDLWSTGVVLRAGTERTSSQNVYRWFEFSVYEQLSGSNSTPRRAHDGSSQYAEKITNLSPNTVYHYRSVVEVAGVKHYGEIQSFKTKKSGYGEPSGISDLGGYVYSGVGSYSYNQSSNINNAANTSYAASVATRQADTITNTSARLNANIPSSGSGNVYGWFEWGNNSNPEKTTARTFIGKGQNLYFNQFLTGLTPRTLYFFRSVIEDANGNKTKGLVFVFQTTSDSLNVTTNASGNTAPTSGGSGSQSVSGSGNKSPVKVAKNTTETTAAIASQKTITIKESSHEETLAPGETASKTLVFENTTGKELNNVSARIILPGKEKATNLTVRNIIPGGKTYFSEGSDTCKQSGQVLTCAIGKMSPGQKTEISYETKVSSDMADKTTLETVTTITGEDKNGVKFENVQTSESIIDSNKNNKNDTAAAAFSGSAHSIFPTTIKDWFFVIFFVFLIIAAYFGWKYYSEKNTTEEEDTLEISEYFNTKEEAPTPFLDADNISPKLSVENLAFESVSAPVNEKGAPPPNLPI
jgi:hypothetical protein